MIRPERREAGIRRRLRIPWVRMVIRERDNPQHRLHAASYGYPWCHGNNALTKWSPACPCHKRERYDRKRGR